MNKPLTLGSLFDGSGTFPMMAMLSGIVPAWKSEIEPFPIAVTEKRLPFVKHLGDINSINGEVTMIPTIDPAMSIARLTSALNVLFNGT